jgi:phage terminase large subunit-like protein
LPSSLGANQLSWSKAWCHGSVLERRQTIAARLSDFSAAGDLTIVDHASDDIEEMTGIIADIAERGLLGCVAVDPAGLGEFVEAMAEIDVYRREQGLGRRAARLRHDECYQDGGAQA